VESHAARVACRQSLARFGKHIGLLALAIGLLLSVLARPAAAQAPAAITLASLQISIWPEFDRPSSLVIIEGQLAPSVALPAQLQVRIPAAAKAPNAVAMTDPSGNLLQLAYTTAAAGGDIIIEFTTSSAGIRVEYYDPALVISGSARTYAFRWQTDYPAAAAVLRVQEPSGATNVVGQPALTPAGAGEYGLNYDTASLGALTAGAAVSLNLSYVKSSPALSATEVAAAGGSSAAAGGPSAAAPAAASGSASLPWVVGSAVVAGLALVGGGAAWYWRSGRPGRGRAKGRRSARAVRRPRAEPAGAAQGAAGRALRPGAAAEKAANVAEKASGVAETAPAATKRADSTTIETGPARFCTQCGQRHLPGDRFCRRCGTPVRE
jgi:hypothetical protein